ncbi:MAG: hypothetical protein HY866_21000 [Chloroflexi bacterium]|nr:hypothetical protein [Chloroflexota bacterium]
MKKFLVFAVLLTLLPLAGISNDRAEAATATFNFNGASVGTPCVDIINADPNLIATEDGASAISATNNAGGSAPECHMDGATVFRIGPASGMLVGVNFLYSGSFYIEFYNSVTSTVVHTESFSGTGAYAYSGAEFDDIYLRAGGESGGYIDNASVITDDPSDTETVQAPGCDQLFPILSSALVTFHQPGFWRPGGDEIVLPPDKTKLDVLHDVDQNGQDEFLVIARGMLGDEPWVGLFIGACHPVYVPLANVTLLRPMEW